MQDHAPERLPLIDAFPFAEAGKTLSNVRPVAGFARLQDLLASNAGEVAYEVRGTRDEMGRLALRVKVSGDLQLTCQRCLRAMEFPLAVDQVLVLARDEAEIEGQPVDPDAPDRIVGGKELAVGTLLEDEILLAIPFAPRHEHCVEDEAGKSASKASPFSSLRGLLNRGGRAGN